MGAGVAGTLLTRLSVLYVTVKQFSEIVRLFQTPLGQSAPKTASHHFLLGYALIQLKQYNEAQDHFRQCLANATARADAWRSKTFSRAARTIASRSA